MTRAVEIMKSISMFDIDVDYKDPEARKELGLLFNGMVNLVDSDPKAKDFFSRFISSVDRVIRDMGVIESPSKDDSDDLDSDDEVLDLPDSDDGDVDKPTVDLKSKSVDDKMVGDSYNYLVSRANSFLYI